jgi:hypothetical protein
MSTTETNTIETIPVARLNAVLNGLTGKTDRVAWERIEVPYRIRISRANPAYSIFDYRADQRKAASLKHSSRCKCGCKITAQKWSVAKRELTIYVPVKLPLSDEPFTLHLGLSRYTYGPYGGEQLDTRGYSFDAEFAGAIISAKISDDPWFLRRYILARDQRAKQQYDSRCERHETGFTVNSGVNMDEQEAA